MKTKQQTFIDFLGASDTQLVIPVYQRVYAWTERQCDALWNDALRAGRSGSTHFIGTMLYATETDDGGSMRLDLIDGQQRAATITLLLTALRNWLRESGATLEGVDAQDITKRYLHVADDGSACKLLLSRFDRATMEAVIEGTEMPGEDDLSANVTTSYERFRSKMDDGFAVEDAQTLWRGIQHLLIIAAELEGEDRAQLIFESLNSKGMALTTADLVRNLLLVNTGYEEQMRLYERYWAPIERLYADDAGSVRLNAALHGWLAITAPQLHVGSQDDVYSAFKTYMEDIHSGTLEELLIGLKGFCETFAAKSQASGAKAESVRTSRSGDRPTGIISEKKLFGD